MRSYRPSLKWGSLDFIVILSLVISTFLVPPTMLGLKYTYISLPLLTFALVLFLISRKGHKISVTPKALFMLASIWCYYLYLCVQSVYFDGGFKINYLKAVTSITIFIIVFSIVFSKQSIRYFYFKAIISVLVFFVISNVFTVMLSFVMPAENLLILEIPLYEDAYKLQVFFPATVVYGRMTFFGDIIMRLSALFREPGITQAFYIWAFIVSSRYFHSKFIPILLLLGLVMTLSTTGFLLLSVVILLTTLLEKFSVKRFLLSMVFVLFAGVVYMVVPGVNLESKNAESYDARIGKLEQASKVFLDNPFFGTGASNAFIEGTSTSLLQQSYAIGSVGVALFLLVFFIGFLFELSDWRVYSLSMFPLISTALVAQPIYDSSILFLFALACHSYSQSSYKNMKFQKSI